ncbi:DUF6262 family protein [Nesterenkonia alkaliphila]|uniref:Transposase n=1 Tax=Nesterenkonia alkaliphila TaxID=1463631 RepID=A0A7K1UJK8_9MICC|nr:DUF6262 family protein [Nesterenkonia alkaliphila]MVT26650.1 transposase [Nesterenkonia alkaliphila]GFZ78046.1 transposase [Nesterenkonia alkaliphila]
MHADNSDHLIAAAKRRHEDTRARAIEALRDLDREGGSVTFPIVAQKADVSRSWLYTQDDICAEIQRLRDDRQHITTSTSLPASQRSTDASILRRLEIANTRVRELTTENRRLRQQLEHALGRLRTPITER